MISVRFLALNVIGGILFTAGAAMADAAQLDSTTGLKELPYAVNSEPARYAYTGSTLLKNITIIDGLGNEAKNRQDVLVEGGRIARIAPGGSIQVVDGTKVIDGKDLTVLPGLIDLHIHMSGADRFASALTQDTRLISDVYRYKAYLYGFLYSGVTTVLDAGTVPSVGVGLKRLVADEYILGPRYFWSGPILEGGIEPSANYLQTIPTSDKIGETLSWLQYMDVDFIKIYRRTPIWMLERISHAAHERGMRVFVDAWERNNFSYLSKIGRIDGYAHLNFHFVLDDTDVRDLAEKNNFVITTFYALNAFSGRIYEENPDYYNSPLIADVLPPEYLEILKSGSKADPIKPLGDAVHHLAIANVQDIMGYADKSPKEVMRKMSTIGGENTRKLLKAGVLIGAGTDGGQGESMLTELELIVADAKIAPVEAIQIATSNGAKILGKEKEFGSITEGLMADLLIVEGKPHKNIRDLRNIKFVLKNGKIIDRSSLTRQWAY